MTKFEKFLKFYDELSKGMAPEEETELLQKIEDNVKARQECIQEEQEE